MTIEEGFARHGSHRPGSVCFECERIRALAAPEHDHETTWCARCVEHGVVEQVRREDDEPKPNDDAVERRLRQAFMNVEMLDEVRGVVGHGSFVDRFVAEYTRLAESD